MSAARYRNWEKQTADSAMQSALCACADREEEIACRVEALYSDATSIQRDILARNPDLANLTGSLYSAFALDQQFTMHAGAERFGASAWRSFAKDEQDPEAGQVFLDCALLEETNAAFLESITRRSGRGSGSAQIGELP